MTRINGYWLAALGLTAATFAASAWCYAGLPETIPTHWNIHGEVDGYGSKTWATFLMPGFMLAMLVFFWFLPALSPRNFEVDTFRTTYLYVMLATTGLFAYIHGVILFAAWRKVHGGGNVEINRVLFGGMFLFFALIGNVMGKVRRNFYIGVRVPWTLASDRVWNDTHRLAAWTMVSGGLLGFLMVVAGAPVMIAFGLLIVSALVPVVYSFVHYKQLERRGMLAENAATGDH
jgi:uncharacterized membrane protein